MKSKLEPHIADLQAYLDAGNSIRDIARKFCLNGIFVDHTAVMRFISAKSMTPGGALPAADAPDAPDAPPADAPPSDAPVVELRNPVLPVASRRCAAPPGADVAAADARAFQVAQRVNIPKGHSIYPCPTQFFPWAEPEARDWYQIVTPGGGETTLSEDELLQKFGARS